MRSILQPYPGAQWRAITSCMARSFKKVAKVIWICPESDRGPPRFCGIRKVPTRRATTVPQTHDWDLEPNSRYIYTPGDDTLWEEDKSGGRGGCMYTLPCLAACPSDSSGSEGLSQLQTMSMHVVLGGSMPHIRWRMSTRTATASSSRVLSSASAAGAQAGLGAAKLLCRLRTHAQDECS